jgi:hypothetical protein
VSRIRRPTRSKRSEASLGPRPQWLTPEDDVWRRRREHGDSVPTRAANLLRPTLPASGILRDFAGHRAPATPSQRVSRCAYPWQAHRECWGDGLIVGLVLHVRHSLIVLGHEL